ncbi:glycosyltransferase [uncultured Amnibacterium sp.]|uniref:glycosyltransferase n=1 Tax=uncultured Amnibacterium sp. TaxID=1631851 RepID=UPI0035CC75EE
MTEETRAPLAADVYLMAFACEPHRGSEPGVGFAAAAALGSVPGRPGDRRVLVTRPHRVDTIRAELDALGAPPIEVLAIPLPRLLVRLTGRRRVRLAYVCWQWTAVRTLRRRLDPDRAAVVHHVTFASEGVPTFESRLRDRAALVFGPAGSSTDAEGEETLSRRLRRAFARRTLSGSDVLVAQSHAVAEGWRRQGAAAAVVVEPNIVIERGERLPPRWDVVCVGRLIPRKRVDLALRAFALGAPDDARLGVLGDGPLEDDLRALAAQLEIDDRVDFLGEVERAEVLQAMASARVLLHASRQEGAPWVIGEAQSVGAHPIALRGTGADEAILAGGFGTVVDEPTPEALAVALADALAGPDTEPSDRWSAARLPDRFTEWYALALERSSGRLAR